MPITRIIDRAGSPELEVVSGGRVPLSLPSTEQLHGHPVVRLPEQLRLHPSLKELGCVVLDELNKAAQLKEQAVPEPILITTNGIILAGFGRWRLAILQGSEAVHCLEYPIGEEDSLQFILRYHQPRRTWNAYVRIRMALTLEPYFQQQALKNLRAGGKHKGLANLPKAQHVDVRQEVARLAGVSPRNVSNVKTIQQAAHSRLLEALLDSALTINRAIQLCKWPKAQQLEQFTRYQEERAINKEIRQSIQRSREEKTSPDIATVLEALRQQEARQPGSVLVRESSSQRSIVFVSKGLDVEWHPKRSWS